MRYSKLTNRLNTHTNTQKGTEINEIREMMTQTASNRKDETPSAHTTQHPGEGTSRWTKLLIALFLVSFILFVVLDSTIGNGWILDVVEAFLNWIEDNTAPGIFVFIVVYFVATIFFIPGSILTLGAGFVFANAFGLGPGVLLGTLTVFLGASSGAVAAFLLGRFLLRDWVSRKTQKYTIFEALDNALAEKGFRIMALLRLSPIIPFNVLNYVAGVTAIGFWQYVWAMFAILPGTVLYVFLGASAGSLADSANGGTIRLSPSSSWLSGLCLVCWPLR